MVAARTHTVFAESPRRRRLGNIQAPSAKEPRLRHHQLIVVDEHILDAPLVYLMDCFADQLTKIMNNGGHGSRHSSSTDVTQPPAAAPSAKSPASGLSLGRWLVVFFVSIATILVRAQRPQPTAHSLLAHTPCPLLPPVYWCRARAFWRCRSSCTAAALRRSRSASASASWPR